MNYLLVCCAAVLLLTACVFEKKLDASSEETLKHSIQKVMEDLSPEDQQKFQDALKMIMFSDVSSLMDLAAMGQNMEVTTAAFMAKVNGKTANEVIAMGEQIRLARSEGKPAQKRTTTVNGIAAEAKQEAIETAMQKTVSATLKSIKRVQGDYQEYVTVEIEFENLTEKNIKGVKGAAMFNDMFGDLIKGINVSSDVPVPAGKKSIYKGSIDVNRFQNDDLELAGTSRDKIEFSFVPEMVVFEDGSRLSIE